MVENVFIRSLFPKPIPKDWRLVSMDFVILRSEYGLSIPTNTNGTIRIVGMKDIDNGIVNTKCRSMILGDYEDYKKYILKRWDILLNRTNSPDLVGKVGIVRENSYSVFASYLVRLHVDHEKADPEFINFWLNSHAAQVAMKRISTRAVSQANINPTEFKKYCPLPLPPLPEQRKIAAILRTWDEAIEKLTKLREAKQRRLEALAVKLIHDAQAERVHLRNFLQNVSVRNRDLRIDRVLSVTNSQGFVLAEDQFAHRVASADLSNYKIVRRGQYAYNPSRINVGSIARLDAWEDGVLSPMYVVFEVRDGLDSDFFKHWLRSSEARQRIALAAQGSVRETVNLGDLGSILIPVPSLERQKSIARALNEGQLEIDLLDTEITALKRQKRGLMQKLLTGEWRVKPDSDDLPAPEKEQDHAE